MRGELWAGNYIGLPWDPPHRDCWSFFREVQKTHFGLDLPIIDVDPNDLRAVATAFSHNPERAHWVEVQEPKEGDAVLMSRAKQPVHVGIWLAFGEGRVIHCAPSSGVLCQPLESLRLSGWGQIRFYTHQS
jgi:cell wall-associated NlpC family hydrolase